MVKKEGKDKLVEKTIFTYSIEHLPKKDKVRFYYALKGRDGKTGIIKKCQIEQLGRAVLLVQQKHDREVTDFLKFWKCDFNKKRVWVEK